MASSEIHAIGTTSGNQPRMRRIAEAAAQTFKAGVPVQLDANGRIKEWDGVTTTRAIAGFCKEFGKNLTTAGVAQQITQGNVPNQASAVNLQRPYFDPDGADGFEVADQDSMFQGQVGPAQQVTQADVGVSYGMTKDTDGHWYVDRTKVAPAAVVVTVVKLDPNDQSATPRGVFFTVLPSAAQIVA